MPVDVYVYCLVPLFQVSDYVRDIEEMQMVSKEDYLVSLRRHAYLFIIKMFLAA